MTLLKAYDYYWFTLFSRIQQKFLCMKHNKMVKSPLVDSTDETLQMTAN